jgi:hypothetical protein
MGVGLVASGQSAASAAPSRNVPITPAALGSLYGAVDPGGMSSVRLWGGAIWCYVQPTADANIAANLDQLLAPGLDQVAAVGGTAIVTIGHPAPWVFDNHPRAVRPTKLWSCGNHASSVSIPSPAALKPVRGQPSVQAQRWAQYVSGVVDWLTARYAGRIKVILESWNEPNLSSGLNPSLKIPGAAQTPTQAALALHAYESIASDVLTAKGVRGWVSLGSSAVFTRPNTFSKVYLQAHNKKRRIDSIHFNIYGFNGKTATGAVVDWDKRAAQVRKRLSTYRALRRLPAYVTEANLNLVNSNSNRSNLRTDITSATQQRRMSTATQMNAYYHGFSAVYWLIPWRQQQAAVFVRTEPGNVARDALAVLHSAVSGTTLTACSQRSGLRTCSFQGPQGRVKVLWRNSGTSKVKLGATTQVLEMTGASRTLPKGTRLTVGTTPLVLR